MQYKGFKLMKRVAAVIVSAAIMLADIQGVSAAGVEQAFTVETMETMENGSTEDFVQEVTDEGLSVEELDTESHIVEDIETVQIETVETMQTEIIEAETTQTNPVETTEAESIHDTADETQTEEKDQIMSETEESIDASEIAVSDEVVAEGDEIREITFWHYDNENKNPITEMPVSISINKPITIVPDFGAEANLPMGAKVQWDSNELTPTYVKVVQADTVMNAVMIEGLKPTESDKVVKITCYVSDSAGKIIYQGFLDVKVNPLVTRVSVKIGNSDATGKEVIYQYVDQYGDNKFIASGGATLPETDQKAEGFAASVYPNNANPDVKWKSSNPSIISFPNEDDGKIVVNGIGEVTITATSTDGSNIVGSVKVKVRRLIRDLSFKVKPADKDSDEYDYKEPIKIAVGTSISITPIYDPGDATVPRLRWTNGNENALDIVVNENTNVLTVTAKSTASNTTATLTAETTDMSALKKEIYFEVTPKVEHIKIRTVDANGVLTDVTGKSVGYDPITYDSDKPNNVYVFAAEGEPEGALESVNWKISNSKIATARVTEDNKYEVTINPEMTGTAVITATAKDGSNISASTTLRVGSLANDVEIQGSNVVMKGRTVKLTANVVPKSIGNVKFKWESYNPGVASVNEITGEVTGKTIGFATIVATATDGSGKSRAHIIRVTDPPKSFDIIDTDPKIADSNNSDSILTGKTVGLDPDDDNRKVKTVEVKILPDTASQTVEWKSSNENIVTLTEVENSEGKQIKIEAKAIGTATITAKALDGSGKTASIKVNVNTLATGVNITGGHYLARDMTLQLKAEVLKKDAANKSVVWKSDAPKIAEVDEHGLVTAVGKDGTARITAEAVDGSGEKTVHNVYVVSKPNKVEIYGPGVRVDKKTLEVDLSDTNTFDLEAQLVNGYEVRDGYPRDIKWSTSSKNIATVEADENDPGKGHVTIYKKGTVNITATTTEGYASSSTLTIKVKNVTPKVEITGTGKRLARGKKMKLSAGSVAVNWESDKPEIAKVNKNGQVTAEKYDNGDVTIMATPVDEGKMGVYELYVGDPVQSIDLTLNGVLIPSEEIKKKIGVDILNGCKNNKYKGNDTEIKLGTILNFEEEASIPGDSNITWKSSNKNVAVIDEKTGEVTLKKNGNVTFTATATDGSNKKAKITFVVSKQMTEMYPVGCSNSNEIKDVHVGLKKSIQLSTEIRYKPLAATKPQLIWEVVDESDAVSVGKNNGKVTGKIEGDALIKATDANNANIYCMFRVWVDPPVNKVVVVADGNDYQSIAGVVGIDLSDSVPKQPQLKAKLYAKDDEEDYDSLTNLSDTPVIWSSSNKSIASVDENGVVTAHKNGEVTITATATDGSKKKGKIKVCCGRMVSEIIPAKAIENGITLDLGEKTQKVYNLGDKLTVKPVTATNQKLTYISTDKTVATVNGSGKVTAKGEGFVDIIVTSKDGGAGRTIPVYVYDSSY